MKPNIRVYRAWVLIEGRSPRVIPCFSALRAEVQAMDERDYRNEPTATWTESWTELFKFCQKHKIEGSFSYELPFAIKALINES